MELDNSPGILHVATGDWEVVKDALKWFNKSHPNSKLKYLSSEAIDGVMFSYIDAREATVDHIFLFGYCFMSILKDLQDKGKIDWL